MTRIAPFITGCCHVDPNATPLPLATVPMRGVQPSRVPLKRESHLCAAEKRPGVCAAVFVLPDGPGVPVVTGCFFLSPDDARSSASSVASGGVGSSHDGAGFGNAARLRVSSPRGDAARDADAADGEVTSFHGAIPPFTEAPGDSFNSLRTYSADPVPGDDTAATALESARKPRIS